MRAVDKRVLLCLITRTDERATAAAEAFIAKGAWVSHLLLADAMWDLRNVYGLPHEEIAAAIDMLLDHQHIAVEDRDVVQAALQCYRQKPSLGLMDCLILEVARKAGTLPLAPFDKALSRLEGAERL